MVYAAAFAAERAKHDVDVDRIACPAWAERAHLAGFRAVTALRFGKVPGVAEEFRGKMVDHANRPVAKTLLGERRPAFNHTRADGPFDPCPECLELMNKAELIALAKDRSGHYELLRAAGDYVEANDDARCQPTPAFAALKHAVERARGDR